MIYVALLAGIIAGAAAMGFYTLAHTNPMQKLTADVLAELNKIKQKL